MYANNITNLVEEFWNKDTKRFDLNLEDDIIKSCLLTHHGAVIHPRFAPADAIAPQKG
jgi:NAD(P) transhydrogenase subunit alpha